MRTEVKICDRCKEHNFRSDRRLFRVEDQDICAQCLTAMDALRMAEDDLSSNYLSHADGAEAARIIFARVVLA